MRARDREGRRWRRSWVAAGFTGSLVALGAGIGWLERAPIATHFVDRELARRGVAARYRIVGVGPTVQRLEGLSIGDPAHPDLVADWAELRLGYGLRGPELRGVAAGGVRLRGRVVEGRLSLGAIDRLLPAPSGKAFALPELDLALEDAVLRLETPAGVVGLAVAGRGNLAGGFKGKLAVAAPRLRAGECSVDRVRGTVDVMVADRLPGVRGPVAIGVLDCVGVRAREVRVGTQLAVAEGLDRVSGRVGFAAPAVTSAAASARSVAGEVQLDASAEGARGTLRLGTGRVVAGRDSAGRASADLRFVVGKERSFEGSVGAGDVRLANARLEPVARAVVASAGTPVAPIAASLERALRAAAGRFSVSADVDYRGDALTVRKVDATSASGARLSANGAFGTAALDGAASLSGGGLPDVRLTLAEANGATSGQAVIAPIAAGGARVALAPVSFAVRDGVTTVATRLTLDGPLGDGRVEGLTVPVAARLDRGGLTLNPGCTPLSFASLSLAGSRFGASRLQLCASGPALLSPRGFGATIANPRLAGTIGSAPLALAADSLRVDGSGFAARAFEARIAEGTRLAADDLVGGFADGAVAGKVAGLAGHIANVPLELSEGAGDWRLAGGVLDLTGALRVADQADPPRFNPLRSADVKLRLADGTIRASGTLLAPDGKTPVTQVALVHALGSGVGRADLGVAGLRFSETLQPEALTRLTLGVVANVRGEVTGKGWVAWNADGVTSGGTFRSDGLDLAAAFGPVSGLAGEIRFSDLLGLVTPPGQVATIKEINPGIAVTDGVVRYRLLPGFQIAVEGGRWPFSGGELALDPTTLDFAETASRQLTFRVTGLNAAEFVQQFEFDNVAVTGTFDGTVPMIFDKTGGRIEGGRLSVREAGGTLAYVGPISNAQLGTFGSLAFDALKSIRYSRLAILLDGSLDGEIISQVLFDGTNEAPIGAAPKKAGFLARMSGLSKLTGLPFRFRITIRAPFRGLLNSAESINDPRGLISRSVPKDAIQSGESEGVR